MFESPKNQLFGILKVCKTIVSPNKQTKRKYFLNIFTDQSTQSCDWRPNDNFDEPARHGASSRAINFGRILTTFEEQTITVVETSRHFKFFILIQFLTFPFSVKLNFLVCTLFNIWCRSPSKQESTNVQNVNISSGKMSFPSLKNVT